VKRTFGQPFVGQRLHELREQAGLSRAQLSAATKINASAIVRLERGDDVRLSTYLPITEFFLAREPEVWMLADRILLLPTDTRAQVNELVAWYRRSKDDGQR
jgi:transcriptional regulator with XRE-family HTH domain